MTQFSRAKKTRNGFNSLLRQHRAKSNFENTKPLKSIAGRMSTFGRTSLYWILNNSSWTVSLSFNFANIASGSVDMPFTSTIRSSTWTCCSGCATFQSFTTPLPIARILSISILVLTSFNAMPSPLPPFVSVMETLIGCLTRILRCLCSFIASIISVPPVLMSFTCTILSPVTTLVSGGFSLFHLYTGPTLSFTLATSSIFWLVSTTKPVIPSSPFTTSTMKSFAATSSAGSCRCGAGGLSPVVSCVELNSSDSATTTTEEPCCADCAFL
mmetsp:Transcript_23690/g.54722  ORF Transcript_23690/g.54722 Transcript_23690/m.54722 type:complete len:270 (-) Transcript_23690:75-884(-)